jgi:hypothetical protein
LAVYLLEGHQRPVDTEDVAVKVHELAPGRFTWRKYPEQINLELVRVYLSAAKDPTRGGWIDGTGRSGWTLTPGGLEWAKTNAPRFLERDLTRRREERPGGSVDEQRWQRERNRLIKTLAWAKWAAGAQDEIKSREAAEVFRIDSYAVGRTRDLKITRLREMFDTDPEIGPFLTALTPLITERENTDG